MSGRFAGIALCFLSLALPGPAGAQTDLPADPNIESLFTQISTATAGTGIGPILYVHMEAQRMVAQSSLWDIKRFRDDALMQAWTTQSLAQLDEQVHMATSSGQYLIDKLKNDIAWFENEYGFLNNPNAQPSNAVEEDARARRDALKALLAEWEPKLRQQIEAVNTAFAEARARLNGGYVQRLAIQEGDAIAQAMLAFGAVAAEAERKIAEAASPGLPISVAGFTQTVPLTPHRQLQLTFVNQSTDLVFFVRFAARQPDGSFVLRDDTRQWVPLYPQNAKARLTDAGPNGNPLDSVLGSQVWLPAMPGDRLEVRVATYGPYRQDIRWEPLTGSTIQPELTSLRRGYYYISFVSEPMPGGDRLVSRTMAMNESYSWRFNGLWEAGTTFEPTDTRELREAFPEALQLTNDHIAWPIPELLDTIIQSPIMEADIAGEAHFRHVGPHAMTIDDQPAETGSGKLLVRIVPW